MKEGTMTVEVVKIIFWIVWGLLACLIYGRLIR